jgi:alkylresorcinol/alkylpyrone synthase
MPIDASRTAVPVGGHEVRLRSLVTRVPAHVLPQERVREMAKAHFGQRTGLFEHLEPVFTNARIERRYACQPFEWYLESRDFGEKSRLYAEQATALCRDAAGAALAAADLTAADIDAIAIVSTTGVATPSLDARLMNLMPFRRDTIRLPIFGFGCAGGVLGLTRAAQLARSQPGMRCLLLVVELCTMAIRHDRVSPSNIVATALFGDGAAAAIIESDRAGDADEAPSALGSIGIGGEHCWADTLDIMGWRVDGLGLDVVFSNSIPEVIAADYPAALTGFLSRSGLTRADFVRPCCHPGGVKVIDALETVYGLAPGELDAEREILSEYGNMSAPTVLFVLERLMAKGVTGPLLLSSLGPGFTAAFQAVDLRS